MGLGLGKGSVVGLLVILGLWGVSFGAVYKVGDTAGWTTLGNINYTKWAENKNFHVGDTLLFAYHKEYHNVERVDQQHFQSCNATSPIASYATGNDSIVLKMSGHFYFLCGVPGHCQIGQKFSILVTSASATAPTPSPAPAESSPPGMMAPTPGPGPAPAESLPPGMMAPTPAPASPNGAPILESSNLWVALLGLVLIVTGFGC